MSRVAILGGESSEKTLFLDTERPDELPIGRAIMGVATQSKIFFNSDFGLPPVNFLSVADRDYVNDEFSIDDVVEDSIIAFANAETFSSF